MPESGEQKNLTVIVGLLATAFGAFALSLFLGEKKRPLPQLGGPPRKKGWELPKVEPQYSRGIPATRKERQRPIGEDLPWEERESDYYEDIIPKGPAQRSMFFRDITAAEEAQEEVLFPQEFGVDPERIAKYTPVHEHPEITEADIYEAANCIGPHYTLRFMPTNWCRLWGDEPMPADLRENVIRYLESKGYKRP